jgi:hypothetical protein
MIEMLIIYTKLLVSTMRGRLHPPSIISKMEVFSMKTETRDDTKVEVLAPHCRDYFFARN